MSAARTALASLVERLSEAGFDGFMVDRDLSLLHLDPSARRLLGLPEAGEVAADALLNALADGEADRILAARKSMLRSPGDTVVHEILLRAQDGAMRSMFCQTRLLTGEDGTVAFSTMSASGGQAQTSAHPRDVALRQALDACPVGAVIVLPEGQILYANRRLLSVARLEHDDVVGRDARSFYADGDDRMRLLGGLARHTEVRDFETRLRTPDGMERWLLLTSSMIEYGGGRALLTWIHDISRQRRKEEAVRRQLDFQRGLINSVPMPLYIKDLEGRFLDCNRSFEEQTGLEKGKIIGDPAQEWLFCDADPRSISYEQALYEDHGTVEYESHIDRPDGDRRIVVVTKAPFYAVDGTVGGLVAALRDVTAQKLLEDDLRRLATLDPLTEIYNRRAFLDAAERELRRSRRHDRPMALLVLDIDHFKRVNDTHGHATGDAVLKGLAQTLRIALRGEDIFGRMGGEEFAVALPETGLMAALDVAERLRRAAADPAAWRWDDQPPAAQMSVTISVGVAAYRVGDRLDALLQRADRGMYQAKERGRNRVATVETQG